MLITRLFNSKVEARLFVIFFVCSAIPFALFSFLGVEELEFQALSQAKEQLRLRNKEDALNVLARLSGIDSQLKHSAELVSDDLSQYPKLVDGVLSVKRVLTHTGSRSSLHFEQKLVYLVFNISGSALEAVIDLSHIWPDFELDAGYMAQCIRIDGASFNCHGQPGMQRPMDIIAVQWDLFLNSAFSSKQIFTMYSQIDKRAALKPIALVVEIVPYIVAAICLFLAFFFIRMLRYRLLPLQPIKRAAQRLGTGDFRELGIMRSGDEFESLGEAFNKTAKQLDESFNLTRDLSKVDRLILSSGSFSEVIHEVLKIGQAENTRSCTFHYWANNESKETNQYWLYFENGKFEEVCADKEFTDSSEQPASLNYPIFLGDKQSGLLCFDNKNELATQSEVDRFAKMADKLSVAITHFQYTRKLYRQANFDSLTGLSNRYAFKDHLRLALEQRLRDGRQGVVIFIDLDRFKQVNDTEGHNAGDRMLRLITTRISSCVRKTDVIARMGGDEFAILINECESVMAVGELCERLNKVISEKLTVDHLEHSVSASIGIAVFPDDGKDVERMLMHADTAMYHAKAQGGSTHCFFDPKLNEFTQQRVVMESRLRRAVRNNELDLHFQPQLDLNSGLISGAEGLLRWTDEELGFVGPDKFIPVAEETGLIRQIEPMLFENAASVIHTLQASLGEHPRIAINVSPRQFSDDFAERVFKLLSNLDIAADSIELEVTESSFISDPEMVVEQLNALRSKGIKIALDDFGTGYSSFNMLRTLPIDVIKIDRAFIVEITTEERALGLAQHIIQIAKTLDKKVIAEGTESQHEIDILRGLGCDYIQGYAFSRPLPRDAFLNFVEVYSPHTSIAEALLSPHKQTENSIRPGH